MNTVRDAYAPPSGQPILGKFWFRFLALSVILAVTLAAALFSAARVKHQQNVIDWNSSRQPPPHLRDEARGSDPPTIGITAEP